MFADGSTLLSYKLVRGSSAGWVLEYTYYISAEG